MDWQGVVRQANWQVRNGWLWRHHQLVSVPGPNDERIHFFFFFLDCRSVHCGVCKAVRFSQAPQARKKLANKSKWIPQTPELFIKVRQCVADSGAVKWNPRPTQGGTYPIVATYLFSSDPTQQAKQAKLGKQVRASRHVEKGEGTNSPKDKNRGYNNIGRTASFQSRRSRAHLYSFSSKIDSTNQKLFEAPAQAKLS